jgi:hypothetical protein
VEDYALDARRRKAARPGSRPSGRLLAPILAGMLVACAMGQQAPVAPSSPTGREVAVDPGTARERVESELRRLGFTLRQESGPLSPVAAELADSDSAWADCPLALARDPDPDSTRASFERPTGVRIVVVAQATTLAGSTHLSLDVLEVGRYRNPYVNLTFEERCRSTGILETKLLDAAGRG